MLTILQIILITITGFFIVYLLFLSILALYVKQRTTFPSSRLRSFCVIIPAHNEELSVARTVKSILKADYPTALFDAVVIADNCTDSTAEISRRHGAEVYERTDTEFRGKGFALRWSFDRLLSSKKAYDAFVVLDADSIVSGNVLRVLNYYLEQGSDVLQAADLVEPQPGVWNSEMTRIGFLLYNYVRGLGRSKINCPIGLRGNGMCFSADILRRVPWEAYSIAEDLEFGLRLLLEGYPAMFAPEAVALAAMPIQSEHAKSQHARWEGGRFPLIRRYFFPLLKAAVQHRSYIYFDALIDLVTPALVNLMVVSLGMMTVSLVLGLAGTGSMMLFAIMWGALSVLGFLHMFVGMKAAGADRSTYTALLQIPRYVLWKMSFLSTLFRSAKSNVWVRTTREE